MLPPHYPLPAEQSCLKPIPVHCPPLPPPGQCGLVVWLPQTRLVPPSSGLPLILVASAALVSLLGAVGGGCHTLFSLRRGEPSPASLASIPPAHPSDLSSHAAFSGHLPDLHKCAESPPQSLSSHSASPAALASAVIDPACMCGIFYLKRDSPPLQRKRREPDRVFCVPGVSGR